MSTTINGADAPTAGADAPIINSVEQAGNISTTVALAEHAAEIRARGRRVIADVIEIGRRLSECRKIVKRGQWIPWLDDNFGWSDDTALRFIKVYELTTHEIFNSRKLRDLNLPLSAVYLISEQSTPPEARAKVVERVEAGEVLSVAVVKDVIKEHKPATARKARSKATPAAIANPDASPPAAGNDVDPEQSAAARKTAYANDAAAAETSPTKPAATKRAAKAEKNRRHKITSWVMDAEFFLDQVIGAVTNESRPGRRRRPLAIADQGCRIH